MGILGNMFSDFKRGWDEGSRESQGYYDDDQYDENYDDSQDGVDLDEEYVEEIRVEAQQLWEQIQDQYETVPHDDLHSDYIRCKDLWKEYSSFGLDYQPLAFNTLGWLELFMARAMSKDVDEYLGENLERYGDFESFPEEVNGVVDKGFEIQNAHYDNGLEYIDRAVQLNLQDEDYFLYRDNMNLKSILCEEREMTGEARRISTFLMAAPEDDIRTAARDRYRRMTDCWLNIEDNGMSMIANGTFDRPEFRRYVFFARDEKSLAGCFDENKNILQMFTLDRYPVGYTFPLSHPQANTLYVAHPVKKGFYLPYDGAEDKIFQDKVDDFIRLVQCLGATEINFRSLSGRSVSETFNAGYEGGLDYRGITRSANLGSDGSASGDYSRNTSKEIGHSRRFDPIRTPYCPDDIKWIEYDPSWQSLVKQRLEGNILEYTMMISSEDAISTNISQKMSLKVSYEGLMRNVDANFNAERDTTFSSTESTMWELFVVFKSLKDFQTEDNFQQVNAIDCPETEAIPQAELTEAEQMYVDELNFMLEDGAIGDAERRLLDRKRIKFGISEDRAAELEAMVAPSLTDDEIEYIETFKEICVDGEVTPRMRKMLDREAAGLGISSERAAELEEIAKEQ